MFTVWFFVFLFGLAVGSFLNAVIYRLEKGESALKGRSYCPHCKHALAWYDLIPLVSFMLLQARCRYCRQKISIQYPLVELAAGLLFVLVFNYQFSSLNQVSNFQIFQTLYLLTIASLLAALFVYDLRHYILPDKILLPAILVSCIWYLVSGIFFQSYTIYEILNTIYSALGASGFFLAIFLFSGGKAMGFGDVKLALFMGLFLGWPNILVALALAFFVGALVGIALILLKRKGMKSEVPFGPFLIGGTFAAMFWGEALVDWYLSLLLV